jgi:maleate cis-trans isomerase
MDDPTGWRANIGVVCGAANIVVEPEFHAMSPPGVATCATRMASLDVERGTGTPDAEELTRCTRYLVDANLDVIVLASPAGGAGEPATWAAAHMSASGARYPITAAAAVVDALRALRVRNVLVLGTGRRDAIERESRALADTGITVAAIALLELPAGAAAAATYRAVRAAASRPAAAVYIASSAVETIMALDALEQDLAVPVLSTVQACFWAAARAAGIEDTLAGFGSLLARESAQ